MKANMTDILRAARLIGKSKVMLLGMACEILALAAVVWNWSGITEWSWLPNATLTVATAGAFIVAWRIAWDYHGRGLNEEQSRDVRYILANANLSEGQREDVQGILANASLNATQMDEVAEAIKSSGLTEPQKSGLEAALKEVTFVDTVFAQKAVSDAIVHLRKPGHGDVVVINRIGFSQYDVQHLEPPWIDVGCPRTHTHGQESDISFLEIAKSVLQLTGTPTVLWKCPVNGHWGHTDFLNQILSDDRLVFDIYDCVPEWRVPAVGDYVLTRGGSGKYTWEQKS